MRRAAVVLTLLLVVSGIVGAKPTLAQHPNCTWAGAQRPSTTGRLHYGGQPFNGNKGIAADMYIREAWMDYNPSIINENLHQLYATSHSTISDSTYVEFGYARGYWFASGGPHYTYLEVVVNGLTAWTDLDDGTINYPLSHNTWRRFKMYYDTGTAKWIFQIGYPGGTGYKTVHQRTVTGRGGTLGQNAYIWAAHEVRNTCNPGYADFRDTWRFSTANNAWIETGDYGVFWVWPTAYQTNPYTSYVWPAYDYWKVVCTVSPCH